ncbi:hypothetical protein GCM10020229_76690 [Kitasatospora albolonga]
MDVEGDVHGRTVVGPVAQPARTGMLSWGDTNRSMVRSRSSTVLSISRLSHLALSSARPGPAH